MLPAQESEASMRPSQTFQKRQKELARQEKQRAKAQRKQQRKLEKQAPATDVDPDSSPSVVNGFDDGPTDDRSEAKANSTGNIA